MFESLEKLDQALLLAVNGWNSPFFDEVFWWISKTVVWIPVYLLGVFLLFKEFSWKTALTATFLALVMVSFVDSSTTYLFKETIQRYRPSHNLMLADQIHLYVKANGEIYKGGEFGFFSSHASNNFAVALFLSLLLRNRYKWIVPISFFCAALISYSRMYLGVHYPSDLLCGALWGMTWAFVFFRIFQTTKLRLK